MNTKTCTVCKQEKPLTTEHFDHDSPSAPTVDGWKGRCTQCRKDSKNAWRAKYKKEHGEPESRRYQQANLERTAHNATKKYRELADWVNSMKAKPCADCGNKFPAVCMDFDHRPGEDKRALVAWMVGNRNSRKLILEEIAKCDLVCSNCHRIRTWLSDRETPWYDKIRKYDHSAV